MSTICCPECDHEFTNAARGSRKRARCPECDHTFPLPPAEPAILTPGKYSPRKPRSRWPFIVFPLLLVIGGATGALYLWGNPDQRRLNRLNEELLAYTEDANAVPEKEKNKEQRLRTFSMLAERDEILARRPDWPPIGLDPSPRVRALAEQIRAKQREELQKRIDETKRDGEERIKELDKEIKQANDEYRKEQRSPVADDTDILQLRERSKERLARLKERKSEVIDDLNRSVKSAVAAGEEDANQLFDPNYRKSFKETDSERYKRLFMPPSDFYLK